MIVELAKIPAHDAERLERRWGVRVALEMFEDGQLTVQDFLWLCEEAADAGEELDVPDVQLPA